MTVRIFRYGAALSMAILAWTVTSSAQPQKKQAPAKKSSTATSAKKKAATSRTAASKKGAPKRPTTTWRNRQIAPTPDRYREIQTALVARGFLHSEEVTGTWNQSSQDALKRFQSEQNIESTGKINSLSLIALGLGPKRDPAPAIPPKSAIE